MGNDPKWYEALPKCAQEAIDQGAHFLMGLFLSLVMADRLFTWWREWVQQWPPGDPVTLYRAKQGHLTNYTQATVDVTSERKYTQLDRVADTKTDYLWYAIGGTVGDVVKTAVLVWLAVR